MNQEFKILPVKPIHFSDNCSLQQGQKDIFEEVISWKTNPPLVKTGRSTFLMIDDENVPFKGVKIKGCGYFDLQKEEIQQPSTKEGYDAHIQNAPDGIKEIHYQIEVNDNDELVYSIPKKRPYGAQLYKQAVSEFKTNEKLLKNNKNDYFYTPIGYAEYKGLKYKGEPLGVTILGMPHVSEIPLGVYFQGNFEEKGLRINPHLLNYWKSHVSKVGQNEPDYFDLVTTLKKLSFEFGESLSHLHEYFVDHDSHLFNATVNLDSSKVVLFDLDHVQDVEEISAQKYFYYSMKDFEIGLVALMSNFILSGLIDGIILFEKLNQQVDDYNFIEGFYKGYFGDLSAEAKADSKTIWRRMLMFAMNEVLRAAKKDHIHLAYDFCEQERCNSYLNIYPYLKDKIQKKKPDFDLSEESHKKIIENFLKQRADLEKIKGT